MLKKILFLPLRKQRKNNIKEFIMKYGKKDNKMANEKKMPAKKSSAPASGLTAAQKKLPPALQKAIAKRSSSKKK
jgi:hypothetical protein